MKRTRKILFNLILILILISGSIAGGFYLRHIRAEDEKAAMLSEHKIEINQLKALIPERSSVLVLSKSLKAGSVIKEEDLMTVQFDKDLIPEGVVEVKTEIIGKELKISKSATTIMTDNDVYERNDLEADYREQQFSYINLPDKLTVGDYVDVRILFPTGQDYIVLSKKKISDLEKLIDTNNIITRQTIWSILDEEEIRRMGSAVVDAYVNGGELYAVEYIEPYLQEAALVNYPENANVLSYIAEDTAVVELAAYNLEVKLRSDLETSLIQYLKAEEKFIKPIELDENDVTQITEENTVIETTNETVSPPESQEKSAIPADDSDDASSFN